MQREISFKNFKETYNTWNFKKVDNGRVKKLVKNIIAGSNKIIRIFFVGSKKEFAGYRTILASFPLVLFSHARNYGYHGICVHAVGGKIENFKYIKDGANMAGAVYRAGGNRYFYLSGLSGNPSLKDNNEEQTKSVYRAVEKNLKKNKIRPQDVFRYWIFLRDIYANYAAFNKIRDGYFSKSAIENYPASTGIGSGFINIKQMISISLEAFGAPKKVISVSSVDSNMQNNPREYGSSFSRAKLVSFKEGVKKIYVSGTSSVGKKGESIFKNNKKENVEYVLRSVEHLLKKTECNFADVVFSMVYFKNKEYFDIFSAIYKERKWGFPYIPVVADICRRDLFFEIECIAARSSKIINNIL